MGLGQLPGRAGGTFDHRSAAALAPPSAWMRPRGRRTREMRTRGRLTLGRLAGLLPVAALVLLSGCEFSGEPGGGEADGPGAPQAGSAATFTEVTPITRFTGFFTVEDGWRLIPCGDDPVPVEGPAIPDLLQVYGELVPDGEEGMFVDVLGQVREQGGRGWLEAMEIRRAYFEGFGCDDVVRAQLAASGTEPFWSLEVDVDMASWSTPDGTRDFVHDGLELSESGSWILDARPAGASSSTEPTLRLEAWSDPCRNQMSGAYSHLRVEVTLDGELYRGCAVLGSALEGGLE